MVRTRPDGRLFGYCLQYSIIQYLPFPAGNCFSGLRLRAAMTAVKRVDMQILTTLDI